MSKLSMRGHVQVIRINGTVHHVSGDPTLIFLNDTVFEVRLDKPFRDSQLNELLYVIIVIVFYATALMTLIITQIKRQRREGTEIDYYDEYLQRNSEVKRTCQTANSIVSRQGNSGKTRTASTKSKSSSGPPPRALATAAFAAAAAGTLLGKTPYIPTEESVEDASLLGQGADGNGNGALGFSSSENPGQLDARPSGGQMSTEGQFVVGFGAGTAGGEGGDGTRRGGLGLGPLGPFSSPRIMHSRERSPMLESIPDEEV
ncbi:hypothetical protein ElyMa_001422100 [Elysia marginata]|uniref:Uncharacterized protein n=1 Tax=Elysia marginata TaxID=1093978 RepID=A0AAV4IYX4_9GAST|nr:hypothetical protein ElyMa_001422100 [Elysia marginata]